MKAVRYVAEWRGSSPSSQITNYCSTRTLHAASCRRSASQTSEARQQDGPERRPNFAPKPVIDLKHIRQNADLYSQNCIDRNYDLQAQAPYTIARLSERWHSLQKEARSMREASNRLRTRLSHSKTFSGLEEGEPGREGDREAVLAEARSLKEQLQTIEEQERRIEEQMDNLATALPNLTSEYTPRGDTPKVLGYINQNRWEGSAAATTATARPSTEEGSSVEAPSTETHRDKIWRNHVHIGTDLDLLDFSAAANSSGWGWYFLKNEGALLETALVQYASSVARRHGFTIVSPPSMVYQHIAAACGFQPRDSGGESQIYEIASATKAESKSKPTLVMAGTAEIPFAAMRASSDIEEAELPVRIAGSSRCYRAEAGAHGASTKGLYRVHEFTKVEMFGWTRPDPSEVEALFDQMLSIQKEILCALGLYCRVLEQPSADLGASAARKQDIEAWFPSRSEKDGGWGEVTSTSICTDYQSRRLATRIRRADGTKAWPYTVNGTALAVPRVLAAILETHWNEDAGCVHIPEVLWPWMHGIKEVKKRQTGK